MALSLTDLLSALRPASWRGIEFGVPDARQETGRRIQRFLFPGVDATAHQDLGAPQEHACADARNPDARMLQGEAKGQAAASGGGGGFREGPK